MKLVIERKREKRSCPQTQRSTFHLRVNQSSTMVGRFTSLRHSISHIAYPFMANFTYIYAYIRSSLVHFFPSIIFFSVDTSTFRCRFSCLLVTDASHCQTYIQRTNFRDVLYAPSVAYSHARCKMRFITA